VPSRFALNFHQAALYAAISVSSIRTKISSIRDDLQLAALPAWLNVDVEHTLE
jgi:hypothetical protein